MRSNRLNVAIGLALALGLSACAKQTTSNSDAQREHDPRPNQQLADKAGEADKDDAIAVSERKQKIEAIEVTGARLRQPRPETAAPLAATVESSTPVPPSEAPAPPARAGRSASMPEVAKVAAKPVATGTIGAYAANQSPGYAQQPMPRDETNTEKYQDHADNPLQLTADNPVSTFSIDVDTGSYTNVRRMLKAHQLPPADSVRAEEFLNYFDYSYTPPATRETPFSVTTELAAAPWNAHRKLLLVGIKGYEVAKSQLPPSNLVFLIDTSGSMDEPDKLPLLRDAFKQMVPNLRAQDRVSIVVYAGSAGLVLPSTPGDQHARILEALDGLSAGGSTNGGAGIALAYAMAEQGFIKGGVNRVVLATDGDFNVGTTDTEALKTLVADKRKSGVALTTLGFGQGNYNEELSEQLADIGNGNHAYVDNLNEARKVLVEEVGSTLFTIAKDVKIQVEFNPRMVSEYRLIGYENRQLRREDFNNDKIDAGEIGAGHDVTALYELTLVGAGGQQVDPLRYGNGSNAANTISGDEIAFVKLRYKQPDQDVSRLIERPLRKSEMQTTASERLRFAASVCAFADALRGGTHLGTFDLAAIAALARDARGDDRHGYRAEFVQLVETAQTMQTPDKNKQVAISQ